jgi:hypothetical protein
MQSYRMSALSISTLYARLGFARTGELTVWHNDYWMQNNVFFPQTLDHDAEYRLECLHRQPSGALDAV